MNAWKPGDVAMVHNEWGVWNVAICSLSAGHKGFVWRYGVSDMWEPVANSEARPLVVIDPEDTEQVKSFADIYAQVQGLPEAGTNITASITAALREFAAPTPPRPDEPTGLGAVVEDEGRRWTRYRETTTKRHWHPSDGKGFERHWGEFTTAVRILSPGVEVES